MSPEPDLVIAGPADVVAFLRACGGVPGEGPPCGGPPGEGPLVEAPGAPGCADRFEVVLPNFVSHVRASLPDPA